MKWVVLALVGMATLACAGPDVDRSEEPPTDSSGAVEDTVTWAPPSYPDPAPRWFVASTGDTKDAYEIDGRWEATVGRCQQPDFVQLLARGKGFGAAVLVALPDSGPAAASYEVTRQFGGDFAPLQARVGLQWYPGDRAYAFRATHGTVQVTILDSVLTGRLSVTLKEETFSDTIPLVAVFDAVPVEDMDEAWCRLGDGPVDTLPVAPVTAPRTPRRLSG